MHVGGQTRALPPTGGIYPGSRLSHTQPPQGDSDWIIDRIKMDRSGLFIEGVVIVTVKRETIGNLNTLMIK